MKRLNLVLFFVCAAIGHLAFVTLTVPPVHAQTSERAPGPSGFADLAEKLVPSVVNISSTQKIEIQDEMLQPLPQFPQGSPFDDFLEEFMQRHGGPRMPTLPQASLGSGFIVDGENGYIVTNNHVIQDADEVRVTLHDDTTLEAEVIGSDDKTDIAILKVKTNKKLTAVPFGDSDVLRVGDWIIAIGNPFGLGGTVTAGIISARQRNIHSGPYDDFLQTDASINRGNSGGPMFNMNGEVIGINTAIFSPSGGSVGIGFAIPSALAKPVIDQIIQYGRTRRGWLGVRIQTVTDEIAESLDLPSDNGALVASVTPDSPAESAGIQPGDVITKFNGMDVTAMRTLPRMVAETAIDEEAEIEVWRNGSIRTLSIQVGELEKAEELGLLGNTGEGEAELSLSGTKLPGLSIEVQTLSPQNAEEFGVDPAAKGVLITKVADMSDAAEKGLVPGDLIIEVNQVTVTSAEDALKATQDAQSEDRNTVLLLVDRAGEVRFTALRFAQETPEE